MKRRYLFAIVTAIIIVMCSPACSLAKSLDGGTDTYNGDLPELQNAIAKQAINCAYAPGTSRSVYRYHGGKPKPAYKQALSQAYGSRSGWSAQTRAGASCDVFVGTVVRTSGYDGNFPRALAKDLNYLPSSSKFKKVSISSTSQLEPGDIIMYLRHGGGGHICIYVEIEGKGYIANAHYSSGGAYGCIDLKPGSVVGKHWKTFGVYRATGDCMTSFSEGDESPEVAKIQDFLRWTGYLDGESDGKYGKGTTKAVKAFQKDAGIEATGEFGQDSLDAIKLYRKDAAGTAKE